MHFILFLILILIHILILILILILSQILTIFILKVALATTTGSFDGGDQGLLNTHFSSWATQVKTVPFFCHSKFSWECRIENSISISIIVLRRPPQKYSIRLSTFHYGPPRLELSLDQSIAFKIQPLKKVFRILCTSIVRVASGVRKINDYQFLSPHYRLIINFLILYRLILSTFLFSGYLALI